MLRYEPETGKFFWLPNQKKPNWWNTKHANKVAGTKAARIGKHRGYVQIMTTIGNKMVYVRAHRLAWFISYGELPPEIDHLNGDRADNRLTNLRAANASMNLKNKKMYSTNSSGYTGVRWHKRDKKWVASGKIDNKYIHLGRFENIEIAAAVARNFRLQNGFSVRHGENK